MSVDLEILMPVHNEEKILPKIIKDIDESINKKISYKIIICEDGSTDNSLGVINNLKDKNITTIGLSRQGNCESNFSFKCDVSDYQSLKRVYKNL